MMILPRISMVARAATSYAAPAAAARSNKVPGPYSPTMLDHFKRPRNRGTLPSPTVSQEGTNPLCGDRVRIELTLEGDVVTAARFTANACAICVAASSMLTELV